MNAREPGSNGAIWREVIADGPLVAVALHAGHGVRDDAARRMKITPPDRLREEDPFTDRWTTIAPTRVVATRSRFEVDLNRPRDKAVYRTPQDAWGLEVWRDPPPEGLVARSLAGYDAFYARMRDLLAAKERNHGRFVVFDLHSYNHRREGPSGPPADEAGNPQVNLGTGTMDRERWAPLVERFMADLRACDFPGARLDVRENVRFRGGHFSRWAHETFPRSACVLAIEFKKFFMNEWTGEPDPRLLDAIAKALRSTIPGVLMELERR